MLRSLRHVQGAGSRARGLSSLERVSLSPTIHQTIAGRKRFYKLVTVEAVQQGKGRGTEYRILLDGRSLRTPARAPLHLPTLPLALAMAAEWDAQKDNKRGIQPATMPLMTLASTAIDQVAVDPLPTRRTVLSYLPTDTCLFFTTAEDRILLKKQKQHFTPLVKWLRRAFDVECRTTESFAGRLVHPPESLARVQAAVESLDPFALACLQCATMECKSLVMGLALLCREVTLEQARLASRLEEECQIEWWGAVEGGHDMDRLNNAVSLSSVGTFMGLMLSEEQHAAMVQRCRDAARAVK